MKNTTLAAAWLVLGIAAAWLAGCGQSDSGASSSTGGFPSTGGNGTTGTGGLPDATGGASAAGGSSSGGSATTSSTSATGGLNAGGGAFGGSSAGGTSTGGLSTGGASTGGASNGGASAGGSSTGGRSTGGRSAGGSNTGGRSAGGSNTGGQSAGGSNTGGASSGGASTGSSGTGGRATGGAGTGGANSGGAGAALEFMLGADISSVQEAIDGGAKYADTDGTEKSILDILKNHGFNTIRLRTFVKPGAQYGYAPSTGSCAKRETYCDKDHTIEVAKQIKAAGMQLLLDFHYSDTWADPGKQIIPEDWRNDGSIAAMATHVRDYTVDVVSSLVDAGARPDMVQVGNEITPGMLIHVPNASTDCWGNGVSTAPVGGSASNWNNLGQLLKAGVEGVRSVDPSILTMVHIENTKSASGVVSWVRSALDQGVDIDAVGLSCYVAFQGEPSVWENTFKTLASTFPDLKFVIAEYNPQRTEANRIIHDLPGGRGLGTFFWEPTLSGTWGESLFSNTGRANSADFAEYDSIRTMVGL